MGKPTRRRDITIAAVAVTALLSGCAETEFAVDTMKGGSRQPSVAKAPATKSKGYYKVGSPYKINGVWYYPEVDYSYDRVGVASWYGPGFHGRLTANGEIYNENDITAAHPTLPLPSLVRVTNLDNGRELVVRLNDRGPYVDGRIIDLSRRSAQLLGIERAGTARVRVQVLEEESRQLAALAQNGIIDTTQIAKLQVDDKPVAKVKVDDKPAVSPAPASAESIVTVPPREAVLDEPSIAPRPQVARLEPASPPAVSTAPVAAVEVKELAPLPGAAPAPAPVATTPPPTAAASTPPVPQPQVAAVTPQPMPLVQPAPAVATVQPAPAVSAVQPAVVAAAPKPQYVWGGGNMAPVVDGPGPKTGAAPLVIEAVATTKADGGATIVSAAGTTLYVQAGAFAQQENADVARTKLSAIGPTLVTPITVGDKQLYRVRVGPVATPEEANRLLQQVIGAGIPDARVVAETNS